jgi:hypothetical protein
VIATPLADGGRLRGGLYPAHVHAKPALLALVRRQLFFVRLVLVLVPFIFVVSLALLLPPLPLPFLFPLFILVPCGFLVPISEARIEKPGCPRRG